VSVAVVTGAAGGIGRAVALRLAQAGHRIVAVDISDRLEEVVAAGAVGIDPVQIEAVQVDLTDPDGPAQVEAAVGDDHVAVLVNNAGITRDARLVNLAGPDFAAVLDINLGATYHLTRRLIPSMRPGSSIISLASRAYLGNFGQYNYSMSKGAIVGMTRALAIELSPHIRVNAIAPGLIATEMTMGIPDDIRTKMVAAIPLGRMGEPAEVAELVAFLAAASYITGEVVVIGGGRSLT
jgi:3-oxoacyl-[acyl-carrier protein] reductase